MKITRRHLIALGSATAAAGMVGVAFEGASWWNQPAGATYTVLSDDEAQFVRALAGVAYPRVPDIDLAGEDANLDRFFDSLLSHMPEQPRQLLRLLLHGLDTGPVLTHGSRFRSLSRSERSAVFDSWLTSDLAELRNAGQSLVLLLGMGWTIHPKVVPRMKRIHSCGYGV
jgi:hypothetical protein